MKRIIILGLLLTCSIANAAERATLQDGNGNETGTQSNPLKVTMGGVSNGDATFTGLTVTGTISNSKIGQFGAADATFLTMRANAITGTKIGTYGASDATFQAVTAQDVTFGSVQGTPLCWSAAGQICICGSCA